MELEDEEGAIVLDPKNSARQYWTDPATRVQREIWRPGDGEGERFGDYYEKPGAPPPLEKRWRLYQVSNLMALPVYRASTSSFIRYFSTMLTWEQSRTGLGPIKSEVNEPPKYVVLDDRAAYECSASDIPRTYLVDWWSHDFGGNGQVRARRGHRGRSAIGDENAPGVDKYHFTTVGTAKRRYYFTGERDYTPFVYRTTDPTLAIAPFKPKKRGLPSPLRKRALPDNKHGHNQFTPKDQMVKYGAPHKGESWKRYRTRVNPFLARDKSPPLRLTKGPLSVRPPRENEGHPVVSDGTVFKQLFGEEDENGDSMYVEPPSAKRQKMHDHISPVETANGDDRDNESDEDFPFSVAAQAIQNLGNLSKYPDYEQYHQQQPQHQHLSERHIAEQDAADRRSASPTDEIEVIPDSGTYAQQLEAELAATKKTVEEQKMQIDRMNKDFEAAREKMKGLEEEVANLKRGVGVIQVGV